MSRLSTASGPLASYGELFSPLQLAQLVMLQPRLHLSGISGQRERLRRLSIIDHQSSHDAVQAEDSYKVTQ
ncbi:hypothetical protein JOQ06_005090 [Pogonophryne albipinna]|uniref:Uncharacterized protein n=1 Tax=Pogonophryne albipinna TaxID=1090488 RepID=A0AAD6ARK4_9TELE|nr:hypothetical protein JOQ06_005090 [Pogonophryne albipinna]